MGGNIFVLIILCIELFFTPIFIGKRFLFILDILREQVFRCNSLLVSLRYQFSELKFLDWILGF